MILHKFCATYIVKQTQEGCFLFGGIVEKNDEPCGMYETIRTTIFSQSFCALVVSYAFLRHFAVVKEVQ